jgi:hypothetical protein
MAQYTGTDQLDGLFKTVYGEKGPVNVIPEIAMLYREVPLRDSEKQGKSFVIPVLVANSHGFTYNTSSATAFALNNSIAMTTQEAEVTATELVLRDAIALRVASRSQGGNKRAFKDGTELVVMNMQESHAKRLEIMYWYGGALEGIATADDSTNVSATTTDVVILDETWADGIWSGLENCEIQFYTLLDALVSSGADSIFTVSRVNASSKTIRVTGTATGITALDSALNSGDCHIFFNGAHGEECSGVLAQLQNTGTLFGIDASIYGLWRANVYDVAGAQLTMRKVLKGAAIAYGRGLQGKARVCMNPLVYADLAADIASYRRYDGSYSKAKAENGSQMISFYGQNGELELVGHSVLKPKDAFLIDMKHMRRLGSTDITFDIPGLGGKIFTLLPNNNGFELRNYSDTAIFIDAPARFVYFDDIAPLDS